MNNSHSQGYWFVLREDQNVIFTSNNFNIQNTSRQDARYIVDTGERQFIETESQAAESLTVEDTEANLITTDIDNKQKDLFWDRSRIKLLLTLCLEYNIKNSTKDRGLLDDIASHLGTTPEECTIKYKNLRRTFLRLFKKRRQGKQIKWVHYNTCEKVFNEYKLLPSSLLEPWDDFKVRNLLNMYIENLERFRGSQYLQKDVWKDIASHVHTTDSGCYHKFKNLKRTYLKLLQRTRETGKPVKWPYYQYFERIFYDYTPNVGPWNRAKTHQLIDAYLQMAEKFRNPKYQKKDLWKEISLIVEETPHDCDKKFRNLKQTYLKLKLRAGSGRCITKWRYYKDFEAIFSSTQHWDPITLKSQGDGYVKQLLQFYVDNKDKFNDPRTTKKQVWKILAPQIGLSSEECDRKFRNLKQTYMRLTEKNSCGNVTKWPYYQYFENIFDEPKINLRLINNDQQNKDATMLDLKRVVQQMHDRKHDDKFERLVTAIAESNNIQRERNRILQALLDRKK